MTGRLISAAAALVMAAAAAQPALAQDTQSFKALATQGFEVKSVALVPVDVAKRLNEANRDDSVVVTLQKGNAVATCFYAVANWINLSTASLENGDRCILRTF